MGVGVPAVYCHRPPQQVLAGLSLLGLQRLAAVVWQAALRRLEISPPWPRHSTALLIRTNAGERTGSGRAVDFRTGLGSHYLLKLYLARAPVLGFPAVSCPASSARRRRCSWRHACGILDARLGSSSSTFAPDQQQRAVRPLSLSFAVPGRPRRLLAAGSYTAAASDRFDTDSSPSAAAETGVPANSSSPAAEAYQHCGN